MFVVFISIVNVEYLFYYTVEFHLKVLIAAVRQ